MMPSVSVEISIGLCFPVDRLHIENLTTKYDEHSIHVEGPLPTTPVAVRKLRNKWWIDFQFHGTRHRSPSPENTKAGAQAYEAALRHRLALGQKEPCASEQANTPHSFRDASRKWFEVHVKTNLKPSGIISYEKILRVHLVPAFGALRLEAVTNFEIEKYKARKAKPSKVSGKLKPGLAPKTINDHLAVLSKLLKDSGGWGWIDKAPKIVWVKVPPSKFDFLSRAETVELLTASAGSKWHDALLCAVRTGMRCGELLALRWSDVDLEKSVLTIRRSLYCGFETAPKSNKIRRIPICADLHRSLASRTRHGEFVFGQETGRPTTAPNLYRALQRTCRTAGLRAIGLHALRHTFASHLAESGVPIPVIQSLLGHSTIQMTMRYAHVSAPALSDAVATLSGDDQGPSNFGHHGVNGHEPRHFRAVAAR